MNFLLNNLELELQDLYHLEGEKLFEEGEVNGIVELNRNLWTASVQSYEVEIQISPTKVKAYSCECAIFRQEKMCSHVAAVLFALRSHIIQKKEKKAKEPLKSTPPSRLTLNSILENISREELNEFIRNYGKSNRQFSLLFKSSFAAKVPVSENADKYVQLLDGVISSFRSTHGNISANGLRQILKVAETLSQQAETLLAFHHFSESWNILKVLLEKLTPLIRKSGDKQDRLYEIISKVFDQLEIQAKHHIAPELKNAIWEFCLHHFPRPAYRLNNLHSRFFTLLLVLTPEEDKAIQLIYLIDEELEKTGRHSRFAVDLISLKMTVIKKYNLIQEKEKFDRAAFLSEESFFYIIETGQKAGLSNWVYELCNKGLKKFRTERALNKLESILLDLAKNRGDRSYYSRLLEKKFYRTWEIDLFIQIKKATKKNWKTRRNKLISRIINQQPDMERCSLLAEVYDMEEMHDELIELIKTNKSLGLLMQHDKQLFLNRKTETEKLYFSTTTEYLEHHIGLVPARKIQEILGHLRESGHSVFAETLFYKLQKEFTGRLAVSNDIEAFLAEIED